MYCGDKIFSPYESHDEINEKDRCSLCLIYSGGRLGANSAKLGINSGTASNFNIYGRLITKRKKGCSYYYSLLNANAKKDGWVRCGLKLEDDFFEEGIDWEYDEYTVLKTVMQVLKLHIATE